MLGHGTMDFLENYQDFSFTEELDEVLEEERLMNGTPILTCRGRANAIPLPDISTLQLPSTVYSSSKSSTRKVGKGRAQLLRERSRKAHLEGTRPGLHVYYGSVSDSDAMSMSSGSQSESALSVASSMTNVFPYGQFQDAKADPPSNILHQDSSICRGVHVGPSDETSAYTEFSPSDIAEDTNNSHSISITNQRKDTEALPLETQPSNTESECLSKGAESWMSSAKDVGAENVIVFRNLVSTSREYFTNLLDLVSIYGHIVQHKFCPETAEVFFRMENQEICEFVVHCLHESQCPMYEDKSLSVKIL